MVDLLGYVLQGLFTGLGVGVAGWFLEKHLKKKLDSWDDKMGEIKLIVKNLEGDLGKRPPEGKQ